MLYRNESGKIHTNGVEFAAADHCNLRCSGCSHVSPFIRPRFSMEDELTNDLGRLATVMHAEQVRILGGEPLLNPRIVAILKAAKASKIANKVALYTNGLLLHKMRDEFWENVDEVVISLYPGRRPAEGIVEDARARATASGARLITWEVNSFRTTMVTEPHPPDYTTKMIFRTCMNAHLFHCHMVHRGWLYKCACPPYLTEFLGRMGRSGYQVEHDGFDIHGAMNLSQQLWQFLTNSEPLDACQYCLGYLGKQQDHHQLSLADTRDAGTQPITRKTHLIKKMLVKESLKYFYRRAAETLTAHNRW